LEREKREKLGEREEREREQLLHVDEGEEGHSLPSHLFPFDFEVLQKRKAR
jgi:hypothetical protein